MTRFTTNILPLLALLILSLPTQAGLWDVIQDTVEDTVGDNVSEQTRKVINDSADELFNGNEEDDEQSNNTVAAKPSQSESKSSSQTTKQSAQAKLSAPNIKWDRYDFIPGDEIIFADSPSNDEENGEFPSRWDMVSGNTEIVEFNGKNVIALTNDNTEIVPYLKNSKEDYLPEVFTIEFDVYFPKNIWYQELKLYLYDRKNQTPLDNGQQIIDIHVNGINVDSEKQNNKLKGKSQYEDKVAGWRHIAIAYTKGKLKVYMDAMRLINIPRAKVKPLGFSINMFLAQDQSVYIKNIRIAKGGVKYYDRLLSDGKIVVNGIRFDIGQSSIKPESNGAINKIVKLMKKNSTVNLSVEGHTDSDGDTKTNQMLSQARAKAVMERIIALGIDAKRLKSKGLGESKPLDNNSSAEGRANNRRVEFVKF